MDRRQFMGMSVSGIATTFGLAISSQYARSETPTLKQTLESGLKARQPKDFKFIAMIVGMVNNKTLPQPLVLSIFHYVREKKSYKRSLVPYFEQALRRAAAKKGIKIP
jgi:hypothetical protein